MPNSIHQEATPQRVDDGAAPPSEQDEAGDDDLEEPSFFEEYEECIAILGEVRRQLPHGYTTLLPTATDDAGGVAAQLLRLDRIVGRYQENPHLLHSHLESLLEPMMELLLERLPTAEEVAALESSPRAESTRTHDFDAYDEDAPKNPLHHVCRAVYTVVRVAGQKNCSSFFPHGVENCESVFYTLRWWHRDAMRHREWEVRYCLLLWLSNLVLVPFALGSIDSTSASLSEHTLSQHLLQTGMSFLTDPSRCREAAALLVARLLTRPDGAGHRETFFAYTLNTLGAPRAATSSILLTGVLQAVATTMKLGKRRELLPFVSPLLPAVSEVLQTHKSDALLCKTAVKVGQRLGLSMLVANSAPWKYKKHVESLDQNLGDCCGAVAGAEAAIVAREAVGEEDGVVDSDEGLEEVIGMLIDALGHKDTIVRWSAAKGLGRMCERLPRAMAEEVTAAVIEVAFAAEHSDNYWHGGLLALAELCRRSLLYPKKMRAAVPIVSKGLAFDLTKGSYSVGAHVRDAASYVCWSIARAYDASDLEEHVHKLSTSLVVTALFDREVNVRRAAAAALQECVGRLGNFPDGIELVTAMDFFSLATLRNSYLVVAPRIAEYEAYRPSLLQELVSSKLSHWDVNVRKLAAGALGRVAPLEKDTVLRDVVPELLRRTTDTHVATRHGALLGLAEIIGGLDPDVWSPEAVGSIAEIIPMLDAKRLFRSRGGENVRQACTQVLSALGRKGIVLPEFIMVTKINGERAKARTLWKCQEFLEDSWRQILEWLQEDAVAAFEVFARAYYSECSDAFVAKMVGKMLNGVHEQVSPLERRGNLLALGALPWSITRRQRATTDAVATPSAWFHTILSVLLRCTALEVRKDAQDAEARRNAVRAVSKLMLAADLTGVVDCGQATMTPVLFREVANTLVAALGDYAVDKRGDVGSFVRVEAIRALQQLLSVGCVSVAPRDSGASAERLCDVSTLLRALRALVKQLMEKMDRVRGEAGLALVSILQAAPVPQATEGDTNSDDLCDWAVLRDVFLASAEIDWRVPHTVFGYVMAPLLLRTKQVVQSVVEGIVVSVGDLSQHVGVPSWAALLATFRSPAADVARLSEIFIRVAASNQHDDRVIVSLCVTIAKLIEANVFDARYHSAVVDILSRELVHYSGNIHKLLPLVPVLGTLCRNGDESVRRAAWARAIAVIASRFPKVRARMAAELGTALLHLLTAVPDDATDVNVPACMQAMTQLKAHTWDGPDASAVRAARDAVAATLQVAVPSADADDILHARPAATKAGSYAYLVEEAGY